MNQDLITLNTMQVRKRFGFNHNLVQVCFAPYCQTFTFRFKNVAAGSTAIEDFDLSATGCDLNFFEELGDSCIDDFLGIELSDAEIIQKSVTLYQSLLTLMEAQPGVRKCVRANSKKMNCEARIKQALCAGLV